MKFFDLKDYYKTNFNFFTMGNLTLKDIEEMLFWEREIYINLAYEYNKKIKENMSDNGIGIAYE